MREEIKKLHTMPMPMPLPMIEKREATPSLVGLHRERVHSKSDNDYNLSGSDVERGSEKAEMAKRMKRALKEKSEALCVVAQLKRALNNELSKGRALRNEKKMLASHSSEEVSVLVRKSSQLKVLANELADTVATKTENIRHLKEVMKLLGTRVTELEKVNKGLKQGHQFAIALQNGKNGQNTHALCNG